MTPNWEAAVVVRQRIGEELRGYRTSRHLTLRELSEKSSVSLSYLSDIERGTKEPKLRTLLALAHVLDLRLIISFQELPK